MDESAIAPCQAATCPHTLGVNIAQGRHPGPADSDKSVHPCPPLLALFPKARGAHPHRPDKIPAQRRRRAGISQTNRVCLLLLHRRQVRAHAFGHFRGHADRFTQRGVRVDGLGDVDHVRAHFHGQGHSLIRSPAWVPTMPPPRMRCVSASKISLVKPSSRPLAMARPEAAQGNTPFSNLMPCFWPRLPSGPPRPLPDRCRPPTE